MTGLESQRVFVITGTDTGVGKTIFASALMLALSRSGHQVHYWKPVQSGIEEVDTRTVQRLTMLPDTCFLPESYVLTEPLSPHRAAEIDAVQIDPDALDIPAAPGILLIEGAGGLHVPLTRTTLYSDMFSLWNRPVILVARTGLGTINHTLLSIEALKARHIPLHGVAFIGEENDDNIQMIKDLTGARVLGRLPILRALSDTALHDAFRDHFTLDDFAPRITLNERHGES